MEKREYENEETTFFFGCNCKAELLTLVFQDMKSIRQEICGYPKNIAWRESRGEGEWMERQEAFFANVEPIDFVPATPWQDEDILADMD
jgi:hypothetical protein